MDNIFETRGKQSDGTWVSGIYMGAHPYPAILRRSDNGSRFGTLIEVDRDTVGVNTGFKDDDDNPIFTGDFLSIKLKSDDKLRIFGLVRWSRYGYYFIDDSFGLYDGLETRQTIGQTLAIASHKMYTFHVVGNMWDNKDMIPEAFRKEDEDEYRLAYKFAHIPKSISTIEAEENVEVLDNGRIFVPLGASVPFVFKNANPHYRGMIYSERRTDGCSGCRLIQEDCSALVCSQKSRKDNIGIIFVEKK